jgi:hypothetical protein
MVDNNTLIGLAMLLPEFPLDNGSAKSCRGTQADRDPRSRNPASHARTRGWASDKASLGMADDYAKYSEIGSSLLTAKQPVLLRTTRVAV